MDALYLWPEALKLTSINRCWVHVLRVSPPNIPSAAQRFPCGNIKFPVFLFPRFRSIISPKSRRNKCRLPHHRTHLSSYFPFFNHLFSFYYLIMKSSSLGWILSSFLLLADQSEAIRMPLWRAKRIGGNRALDQLSKRTTNMAGGTVTNGELLNNLMDSTYLVNITVGGSPFSVAIDTGRYVLICTCLYTHIYSFLS